MQIEKVIVFGVKEFDNSSIPRRIYADIVVLNRTPSGHTSLYSLAEKGHNLDNPQIVQSLQSLIQERNSFVVMGEVKAIDRKSKEIQLTDETIVVYKYLIIAQENKLSSAPSSYHSDTFLPGLSALLDALRMKNSLISIHPPSTKGKTEMKINVKPTAGTNEEVLRLAVPKLVRYDFDMPAIESYIHRLYEVQM